MRINSVFNRFVIRFIASVLALLPHAVKANDRPNQRVIISFDGAGSNLLWERSFEIARNNDVHFTFFLSCTFLMTREDARALYNAPHHGKAKSNIGFAESHRDIAKRLEHIWQARSEGHDIASHACGHFDGKDWRKKDWISEFSQFRDIAAGAWSNVGLSHMAPIGWEQFVKEEIVGFRAPYLSVNKALFPALEEIGFTYDASLVSNGPVRPQTKQGLMSFSLPLIPEGPSSRPIIAMDYNLFVRHSLAIETPKKHEEFKSRALAAFQNAFDTQYEGKRTPLQMGFHFVEMNGSAYWDALEDFIVTNCNKSDVDCVSYKEALSRPQIN